MPHIPPAAPTGRCSWRRGALGALLTASACAQGLPDPDVIKYTRVLAIGVSFPDPPAPGAATRAEGLPLETATITPWIVTPTGPLDPQQIRDQIAPTWYACTLRPGQGVGGCLLGARPVDPASIPDCPPPDPDALDPEAPSTPPPSPCRLTQGPPEAPQITLPLDPLFLLGGDLEVTMIGAGSPQVTTSGCEQALLTEAASIPADCLMASQRVAVGPDSTLLQLAADLGLDVEGPPPPDTPEEPNRNPTIVSAQARIVEDGVKGDPVDILGGDLLPVPSTGVDLEIIAQTSPSDPQEYLSVRTEDGQQVYVTRTEELTGDWSNSWGHLSYGDSQGIEHLNLWTLQQEASQEPLGPGNPVHMYLVVRDDRGGSAWMHLTALLQ